MIIIRIRCICRELKKDVKTTVLLLLVSIVAFKIHGHCLPYEVHAFRKVLASLFHMMPCTPCIQTATSATRIRRRCADICHLLQTSSRQHYILCHRLHKRSNTSAAFFFPKTINAGHHRYGVVQGYKVEIPDIGVLRSTHKCCDTTVTPETYHDIEKG